MIISFLSNARFINGGGHHDIIDNTNCHLYQYIIWVQRDGLQKMEFHGNYMFNLLSNHWAFSHWYQKANVTSTWNDNKFPMEELLSISCTSCAGTKRCEKNVGKSYGQLVQVKSAFENQCRILAKLFHHANVCPLSASCRRARTALFSGLNFAMSGSTPAMDCSVFFHVVPCSVISSKVSSE